MMRSINRLLRRFRTEDRGAVVVDFVPVFFGLIILVLLIFEIGIAYFLNLRSYKAAQLGARYAAVIPAIHSGVPTENVPVNLNGQLGLPCFNPSGVSRCVDPGPPFICSGANLGGECDEIGFRMIVNDMRRTFSDLDDEEVTVSYIYQQLGETGGAFIPEVNVRITGQTFRFAVFRLGDGADNDSAIELVRNPATRYGGVSASAFAENTNSLP